MASSPALLTLETPAPGLSSELLVTWQDPGSRRYHAVGVLGHADDGTYAFRYLPSAHDLPTFKPFLGFSSLDRVYSSTHLFPLFAERILDDSRPDRLALFEALDLVETAGPMEFLARSGGRRAGDTIELLPMPHAASGETTCVFLVHGVRYQPGATDAISRLVPGQVLSLEAEPDNESDPRALLVTKAGTRLGWVPNPLLGYVHAILDSGIAELAVVRANPPDVGHHMRLLVEIRGHLPAGYQWDW